MEHTGCLLVTDFLDYYDHELSTTEFSFELKFIRMKSENMDHESQIKKLKGAEFKVFVDDVADSLLVKDLNLPGCKIDFIRYYQIGHIGMWFQIKNGKCSPRLLSRKSLPATNLRHIQNPIFCIDFSNRKGELFAQSLFLNPTLMETPVKSHLTSRDASSAIMDCLDTSPNQFNFEETYC